MQHWKTVLLLNFANRIVNIMGRIGARIPFYWDDDKSVSTGSCLCVSLLKPKNPWASNHILFQPISMASLCMSQCQQVWVPGRRIKPSWTVCWRQECKSPWGHGPWNQPCFRSPMFSLTHLLIPASRNTESVGLDTQKLPLQREICQNYLCCHVVWSFVKGGKVKGRISNLVFISSMHPHRGWKKCFIKNFFLYSTEIWSNLVKNHFLITDQIHTISLECKVSLCFAKETCETAR